MIADKNMEFFILLIKELVMLDHLVPHQYLVHYLLHDFIVFHECGKHFNQSFVCSINRF
jgi:hypothetical protein